MSKKIFKKRINTKLAFTYVLRLCCLVPKSHLTLQQPHVLQPTRLFCPWDSPARILEWVAMPASGGSSQPRDQTYVSCVGRWIFLPLHHQQNQCI